MFIEIGLEHFEPGLVAFCGSGSAHGSRSCRVHVGTWTVRTCRASRSLGVVWMGAPLLLFPIGQQWIDSSLAGMINGAVPIFATVTAAILLRRPPATRQFAGVAIGFLGVVMVLWPAARTADVTALGAGLILLAVVFYGVAVNLAVPLQQRYGALPVLVRAQAAALILLAPAALMAPRFRVRLVEHARGGRARVLRHGVGVRRDDHARRPGRRDARLRGDLLHPGRRDRARRDLRGRDRGGRLLLGTALVLAGAYLTSRRE